VARASHSRVSGKSREVTANTTTPTGDVSF
jgi:hypothetical protein